ncbi:unnamed protein product [Closterium sp. NIES-64]|nr:unnamed protein product [Closterium sp. NIES-64]
MIAAVPIAGRWVIAVIRTATVDYATVSSIFRCSLVPSSPHLLFSPSPPPTPDLVHVEWKVCQQRVFPAKHHFRLNPSQPESTRVNSKHFPSFPSPRPPPDLVHVAGQPTACGDERLAAQPAPPTSASAVSLLQSLGAVPLGKTNVPHLSMDFQTFNSLFGVTSNPINQSLTPGGSSGGSAAAVAAGMVPFALGTDLEGSLRLPASFCGICSLRPSRDRWPVLASDVPLPSLALLSSLHTYGVFTRTMRDLHFIMTAVVSRLPPPLRPSLPTQPPPLSPPPHPLPPSHLPPPPLRVALSLHLPGSPIDSRVSYLFRALAATSAAATGGAAVPGCATTVAFSDAENASGGGSACREQQQQQQQQQLRPPQKYENGRRVEFVLVEAPRLDFRALDKASKAFIFAAHQLGGGKSSKHGPGDAAQHARKSLEEEAEAERERERQLWEAEVVAARRTQEQQQAVLDSFLSENQLAAWILPVASVLPFAHNPQHSPLTIPHAPWLGGWASMRHAGGAEGRAGERARVGRAAKGEGVVWGVGLSRANMTPWSACPSAGWMGFHVACRWWGTWSKTSRCCTAAVACSSKIGSSLLLSPVSLCACASSGGGAHGPGHPSVAPLLPH